MADSGPAGLVEADDSDTAKQQAHAALVHRARSLKYRTKVRRKAHKHQPSLRRTKTSFESLDEDFFKQPQQHNIGLAIGRHDLSHLNRRRVARRLGTRLRRRTSRPEEEEDLDDIEDQENEQSSGKASVATSVASTRPPSIPEESDPVPSEEPKELPPNVQATDFAALNFHVRPRPSRQLTIDNGSPEKVKNHTGRTQRYKAKLKRQPSYVRESLKRQREEVHQQEDAIVDQALDKVGVNEGEEEEKIEWDVLYECQRGVNGRWSANALMPFDPAAWVTKTLRYAVSSSFVFS